MSDLNALNELLKLDAIETGGKPYVEWLGQLAENPRLADTAPSLIVRAIKSRGMVDIEAESSEERRKYLTSLAMRRIPAWKATDHVRGSHAVVHRIVQHLEAAADNGYQLRQALLLLGGPACGKSFLADAIKACLEGTEVSVVEGCPIHENPINLLKLVPKDKLAQIAETLGLSSGAKASLDKMLAVAGEPCKTCWRAVMFDDKGAALSTPNLSGVNVKFMRLSSRNFGIATWEQNAEGCSLTEAIKQGSGGIVDIPELCAVQNPGPGETLQTEVLINATDARRIPDTTNCGENAGYLPVNAQILAQSNLGSWEAFLKGQKDPDKFTSRFAILSVPYITARIEEELAYRDFLSTLKVKPKFDPLALKLTATLAVLSRAKKVDGLSLIDKVRILNGEEFVVSREVVKPKTSEYGGGYSGGYGGGYSSQSTARTSESATPQWTGKELGEMISKGDSADEKEREGLSGLTMRFMLSFIGQVANQVAKAPRHPKFPEREPVVTSLDMIKLLRMRLTGYRQMIGLTDQQKQVIDTCLTTFLKEAPTTNDTPGVLELEYRRLLREQLLDVFAPTFEKDANDIFTKYRLHARAYGNGDTKVKVKGTVATFIDVDTRFLDQVDKGKSLKTELNDVRAWRGSLDAQINNLAFAKGTAPAEDSDKAEDLDWTTLPELKKAIEERLYEQIGERVEKVVMAKSPDLLKDDDRTYLKESLERFRKLGYDEESLERALEYAKELRLWAKVQG